MFRLTKIEFISQTSSQGTESKYFVRRAHMTSYELNAKLFCFSLNPETIVYKTANYV